jgi:hypothetical protein
MYALPFELSMGTEVLTENTSTRCIGIYINRNPVKAVFKAMRLVPFKQNRNYSNFYSNGVLAQSKNYI